MVTIQAPTDMVGSQSMQHSISYRESTFEVPMISEGDLGNTYKSTKDDDDINDFKSGMKKPVKPKQWSSHQHSVSELDGAEMWEDQVEIVKNMGTTLSEEIKENRDTVCTLKANMGNLLNKQAVIFGQYMELETRLSSSRKDKEQLLQEVFNGIQLDQKKTVHHLNSKIRELKSKTRLLERRSERGDDAIKAYEAKQAELDALREEFEDSKTTIDTLTKKINEQAQETVQYNENASVEMQSHLDQLTKEKSMIAEEKASLKKENANMAEKIADLEKQLAAAKSSASDKGASEELEKLQKENKSLADQKQTAEKDLEDWKAKYEALSETHAKCGKVEAPKPEPPKPEPPKPEPPKPEPPKPEPPKPEPPKPEPPKPEPPKETPKPASPAKPKKQRPYIGVELEFHDDSEGKMLGVYSVKDDGPAAKAGLKVGDNLKSWNGRPLSSSKQAFAKLMGKASIGDKIKLTVVREDKEHQCVLEIGASGGSVKK